MHHRHVVRQGESLYRIANAKVYRFTTYYA